MMMTQIADEINGLFRKYGLDHDVVAVDADWGDPAELVFVDAENKDAMELLLTTLQFVFDGFFGAHPPSQQGRLF